jgi:ribosomal protein S20
MPIIKSAEKALRQNRKNEARNKHFKNLYRESRVAFEQAIKDNDAKKAQEIFYNKKKD